MSVGYEDDLEMEVDEDSYDEWLKRKERCVGSSELAAVMGDNRRCSPLMLWSRKTGRAPGPEMNEAMEMGLLLEPVVAKKYLDRENESSLDYTVQSWRKSQTVDALAATFDLIRLRDNQPVELKTISAQRAMRQLGRQGTDQVPRAWWWQAQGQAMIADADSVPFGVLVGGQSFRVYRVTRDPDAIKRIEDTVPEFWSHVTADVPPDAIPGIDTPRDIAVAYPPREVIIEATSDIETMAYYYELYGSSTRNEEKIRSEYKTKIAEALEGRVARLSDGRLVSVKVSEFEVPAREAHTQRRVSLSIVKPKASRS